MHLYNRGSSYTRISVFNGKTETVTFIPNVGIITDSVAHSFGLGFWAYMVPDLMKFVCSSLMIFKKKTVLNLSA